MAQQASEQGLNWFQDARFGMFIHWGLYSILAKQEWVMHTDEISPADYEKFVPQFNPVKFDADEWISVAADAGQNYVVVTTRHHDGFSMYDTALSSYKITNGPFGRDPICELAEACAKRGDIKIGFYSSLLDWYHPAYKLRDESGAAWSEYIGFLHGQVRELCTNYGEIASLWFDGDWPNHESDGRDSYFLPAGSFEYEKLYQMVHELQPHAVILNNRHAKPLPGEDIQGFEQDLPGLNTTGFNTTEISGLPLEVCMTINNHWGYCRTDNNTKSVSRLVQLLARSASAGANYLLNVGPAATGEIVPTHVERLRGVGAWLKVHGESIYGTRAGAIPPTQNIVSTRRGNTHYVHVLNYASDCEDISSIPDDVQQAYLLRDGRPVEMERHENKVVLFLPDNYRDLYDTVVVLS